MTKTVGRPRKKGLDYFPVDVDIWQDIKIQRVLFKHGAVAFTVLLNLLSHIYRDQGYYIKWGEDNAFLIARNLHVPEDVVVNVVQEAINVDFFNLNLFSKFHILTSSSIQDRYFNAISKRVCVIDNPNYLLVDIDNYFDEIEYKNNLISGAEIQPKLSLPEYPERKHEYPESLSGISGEEIIINGAGTTQSKAQHSKEKHSKAQSDEIDLPEKSNSLKTSKTTQLNRFDEFWSIYPRKVAKSKAEAAWKKIKPKDELVDKIVQAVIDQKNVLWKDNDQRFIPHPTTWLNQERWNDELPKAGNSQVYNQRQQAVPDRNRIREDHEYDDPTDVRHSPYFQEFIKKQEAERQAAKEAKA